MVRGDIFELRAPRVARRHEQQGRRFGVVLQSSRFAALSTVVVAPTSTTAREASFRPQLVLRGQRTRIMVEQLCALDHSRLGPRAGVLSEDERASVDHALELLLGLDLR